jgi:hypothetical protein
LRRREPRIDKLDHQRFGGASFSWSHALKQSFIFGVLTYLRRAVAP